MAVNNTFIDAFTVDNHSLMKRGDAGVPASVGPVSTTDDDGDAELEWRAEVLLNLEEYGNDVFLCFEFEDNAIVPCIVVSYHTIALIIDAVGFEVVLQFGADVLVNLQQRVCLLLTIVDECRKTGEWCVASVEGGELLHVGIDSKQCRERYRKVYDEFLYFILHDSQKNSLSLQAI